MWALLLPFLLVLTTWWRARREDVPLSAFPYLWSTLVLGSGLALTTEVLSLFRSLSPWTVRLVLLGAVLTGAGLLVWGKKGHVRLSSRKGNAPPASQGRTGLERGLWVIPILVLLLTAVQAGKSPPNTLDAFSYHLARVIHWAQNRDIAPYPTHILRQLYQFPWDDEVILWLRLLAGHDGWAAFVQWWALASLFPLVSLLAREVFGARAGPWSAFLVATLPMAILQASSTQNDLVVAYWLTALVYLLFRYRRLARPEDLLLAGLALGLALRTKATAYIWGALPVLWLAWLVFRRGAWKVAGVAALAATLLVAGPLWRNYQVFGHPFGTGNLRASYLNQMWGWKPLLSNVSRNVAVHFAVDSFLRQQNVYVRVERLVRRLHLWMDLDEAHPALTWGGMDFRLIPFRQPNEDTTGAPYQLFFLGLMALPWALSRRGLAARYALLLIAMWVLFSGVFKWQRWIIRLQLPWFILAMVVLGGWLGWLHEKASRLLQLRQTWLRRKWLHEEMGRALIPTATFSLFAASLTFLFLLPITRHAARALLFNELRPLLGPVTIWNASPTQLLWRAAPEWEAPFRQALQHLQAANCNRIGLVLSEGGWEYPWWYALSPLQPHLRLEHLLVDNPSAAWGRRLPPFQPCAIIISHPQREFPPLWSYQGRSYRRVFQSTTVPLQLYLEEIPSFP